MKRSYLNVTLGLEMARHNMDPKGYPWWHQITPQIYLGAIPISGWDHARILSELGITDIVTVTESHENCEANLWSRPVTPEEWAALEIRQIQVETPDMTAPPPHVLENLVDQIAKTLDNPLNTVYIHCKAGKGRSAVVAACLLIKLQRLTAEAAVGQLKSIRKMVNLNQAQMKAVRDYEQRGTEMVTL